MAEVIVFDSDGVLLDSAPEGIVVAANVLKETGPDNRIMTLDHALREFPGADRAITDYRPFLQKGFEYLTLCGYLHRNRPIVQDRAQFLEAVGEFEQQLGKSRYALLVDLFYSTREAMQRETPLEFSQLFLPYEHVSEIWKSAHDHAEVYVSSQKPQTFDQLNAHGINIEPGRIYHMNNPPESTKVDHIRLISTRTGVGVDQFVMINDSVPEIQEMHEALPDVKLICASWGYNTAAQRDLAVQLGAKVLNREELMEMLRS